MFVKKPGSSITHSKKKKRVKKMFHGFLKVEELAKECNCIRSFFEGLTTFGEMLIPLMTQVG